VKTFWMILAAVGITVAGFFLLRRDFDKAFVIAALGMVAWFLNYRAQMKELTSAADVDTENNETEDDETNDSSEQ
jgi:hypothetical protein